MSKRYKILFVTIFALGLLVFSLTVLFQNESQKDETVLAQINDLSVTTSHFENAFKEYYYRTGQVLSPDISTKKAILDTEFNTYVLAVHAMDLNLDDLESSIQKKEAIERRVVTEEYLDQEILKDIEVEERELKEYFLRFNTQLRASHLYARTKPEIEKLNKRLKKGESFEKLAKEVFKNSYMAENGGDIGRFTTDDLDVSFEEAAFKLALSEVSEPVQTAQGYSIIKLTERISKPLLTEYEFNQKKGQIYSYALKKKKELKTRSHLNEFVEGVQLNEGLIQSLWNAIDKDYEAMVTKDVEFFTNLESDGSLAEFGAFNFSMLDFKEEYLASSTQMLNSIYDQESLKDFIKGVAYRSMLLQGAEELGIPDQESVKESISETYYHFLAQEVDNYLASNINNTAAELYNVYQENKDKFAKPLEINLSRIVLRSRDEAELVLKKAKSGDDFSELVKEYTVSNEDRFTDGELGFESIKNYGFLGMELSKLDVGDFSKVIQYQENEFHIYKCLGRAEPTWLSFDQARDQANDFLTKKKLNELRASTIEEVKEKHNAVIDLEKLNELTIQI